MTRLLLWCSVAHDRRTDPVDAHVLRPARLVLRPHLLADDGLLPDIASAAAVLLRPRQREQAFGRQRLAEALRQREVLRVIGAGAQEIAGDVLGDETAQPRT